MSRYRHLETALAMVVLVQRSVQQANRWQISSAHSLHTPPHNIRQHNRQRAFDSQQYSS